MTRCLLNMAACAGPNYSSEYISTTSCIPVPTKKIIQRCIGMQFKFQLLLSSLRWYRLYVHKSLPTSQWWYAQRLKKIRGWYAYFPIIQRENTRLIRGFSREQFLSIADYTIPLTKCKGGYIHYVGTTYVEEVLTIKSIKRRTHYYTFVAFTKVKQITNSFQNDIHLKHLKGQGHEIWFG